jgi:hypothetical protein
VGQNRKGLFTSSAEPTSNPQAYVHIVMRLSEPSAMTDDRGSRTNWTPPRQAIQGNYRIDLVFCFRQCDKEDQVGVKARC